MSVISLSFSINLSAALVKMLYRFQIIFISACKEGCSGLKQRLVLAVLMLQVIYSLGGMKQATTSILPYILGYFMSFNKITLNSRGGGGTALLFLS